MKKLKEKVIGIIVVFLGLLPFLIRIPKIAEKIGDISAYSPGTIIYQVVLIILGILLIYEKKQQRMVIQ